MRFCFAAGEVEGLKLWRFEVGHNTFRAWCSIFLVLGSWAIFSLLRHTCALHYMVSLHLVALITVCYVEIIGFITSEHYCYARGYYFVNTIAMLVVITSSIVTKNVKFSLILCFLSAYIVLQLVCRVVSYHVVIFILLQVAIVMFIFICACIHVLCRFCPQVLFMMVLLSFLFFRRIYIYVYLYVCILQCTVLWYTQLHYANYFYTTTDYNGSLCLFILWYYSAFHYPSHLVTYKTTLLQSVHSYGRLK